MVTQRDCAGCGRQFEARNSRHRFCSADCRAGRIPQVQAEPKTLAEVTRAELFKCGREGSTAGVAAVLLAEAIGSGEAVGAGLAALVREYRATLAEATAAAEVAGSPLDELRARRDAKRTG